MSDPLSPEAQDELAAELALGVLDGEERLRALVLQRSDSTFAAEVELWQVRLAPLLREVEEVPPSDRVWQRTLERIDGSNENDRERSRRRWRATAFVSTGIAAALAVVLLVGPREQEPPPAPVITAAPVRQHVAQLVSPQGKPLLTIAYDESSGAMKVGPAQLGGEGRVPELWIIPEGGAPHSLGELTVSGSTRAISRENIGRLIRDGATLAITLEKREGIPHAAPTLPIIASGTLTSI